jgi:hypothetical protein
MRLRRRVEARPVAAALTLLAVVVTIVAALGAPARSSKSAQTTADEPQYLLSAISLAEDFDLDISDELRDERFRAFHQADLPQQTQPGADGSRISPHDPLLPVLLAGPMSVGGWQGARLLMAIMAGVLAALTAWVAIRRFAVRPVTACLVVGALSITAPLVAYGSQIYPELPAGIAVMVAVAALTGDLDRRGRWVAAAAIVALPWLAVKYTPVAAVLAVLLVGLLWRKGERRGVIGLLVVMGGAGLAYVWFHHAVYGGWTAYAAGDHFVDGEIVALGRDPDPGGRAYRLTGLLADRGFGLVAWTPAFLIVVAAVGGFLRRRPERWLALSAPLIVGWLSATFLAESMHDWSWPGRQVIVVLPLAVVVTAWWVDRHRPARGALVALSAVGLCLWLWLLIEVATGGTTFSLVVDFESTTNPIYRAWRAVLPDYRQPTGLTPLLGAAWTLVVLGALVSGARSEGVDEQPDEVAAESGTSLGSPNKPEAPTIGDARTIDMETTS